jgi:hypothetical protein
MTKRGQGTNNAPNPGAMNANDPDFSAISGPRFLGGKRSARDASFNLMIVEKQILAPADQDELIAHLEQCLGVFTRQNGLLSASELQLKTLLTTARYQLEQYKRNVSQHPFPGV